MIHKILHSWLVLRHGKIWAQIPASKQSGGAELRLLFYTGHQGPLPPASPTSITFQVLISI